MPEPEVLGSEGLQASRSVLAQEIRKSAGRWSADELQFSFSASSEGEGINRRTRLKSASDNPVDARRNKHRGRPKGGPHRD